MDFWFGKPPVKPPPKPRSAFGEYVTKHQHELVLMSCLLGAYATIKVLLLQQDMDRLMHEAGHAHPSPHREHSAVAQCHSDDER
jgi:hypothetical protein